jgi:hypothetical protein
MLSSDSAPKRSYTSFLVVSVIAVRLWADHCRCSLLLASGGDAHLAHSIVRMSCEGVEYLVVIRLISSLTNGILESIEPEMFLCNFTLRYAVFVRYYPTTNIVHLGYTRFS